MPPNAGTRYEILSKENQAANIWVVSLLSVCFSTACLGVRVVSKMRFAFGFGADDYVFGLGWVIQIIQVGLMIKALTLGLGKDNSIIDQSNVSAIEAYTTASTILIVISLYFTKVSMLLLIQRLFAKSLVPFWVSTAVLGVISAIQLRAGCVYPKCTNILLRGIVSVVFDLITELVIIGLPAYCIRNLHMHRFRKAKVLLSFSSRTIVIVFAIVGIWAATRIDRATHYTTSIVLPIVFAQLELCFSLCIAAILPCFRLIFQSSEKIPTGTTSYTQEPKRDGSNRPSSFGMGNVRNDTGDTGDTDSMHSRVATPKPPRRPEHSALSSHDMSGANLNFTGRVIESSQSPVQRPG